MLGGRIHLSGHARRNHRHPVQKQGRQKRLQLLLRDLPSQHRWEGLRTRRLSSPANPRLPRLPRVPV